MTNVKDRYEFIEEMFEKLGRISVEQIVGRYTKLIPRGRHWMGLCPFHRDTKLGSFIVTPDKGMWKCFSCGDEYAGNGVKFVSLYKNITYLEAAFEIAYEFGLITYDEYRRYYRRKYDELYVKKIESRYSQNQKKKVVRKKVNPVIIPVRLLSKMIRKRRKCSRYFISYAKNIGLGRRKQKMLIGMDV